jgi:hypothetical protein
MELQTVLFRRSIGQLGASYHSEHSEVFSTNVAEYDFWVRTGMRVACAPALGALGLFSRDKTTLPNEDGP